MTCYTPRGPPAAAGPPPLYFQISDPPNYENYFLADDTVTCQVVVASPLPHTTSNKQHRLLFAWPAGNSGAALFFTSGTSNASNHDGDGARMRLLPWTTSGCALDPLGHGAVTGTLEFTAPARLSLAILGSVRTIRDYTEGEGVLNSKVQDGIKVEGYGRRGLRIARRWFDGLSSTTVAFTPATQPESITLDDDGSAQFAPGMYTFEASVDYQASPASCLPREKVLNPFAQERLLTQHPDAVSSLAFLCQTDKLLAGGWRFLTYFGRDSMIALLLLSPILSTKVSGAMEAGLAAVLERIRYKDGSVCHEENLGDYPAAQAALHGKDEAEAEYNYVMIDTDFFLPILLKQYSDTIGRRQFSTFLTTEASLIPANAGKTYRQLFARTCGKILDLAGPLARARGEATYRDLVALKDDQVVGQWRDSVDGLGGGRYPYDVNTCLMPAALRAISDLFHAGLVEGEGKDWMSLVDRLADVWETRALEFFAVDIPQDAAIRRVQRYKETSGFPGPDKTDEITGDVSLHALALKADGSPVEVMHTDGSFRLLLLPHLLQSPNKAAKIQHTHALHTLADDLLRTFPAGLFTPVGILVANPALSSDASHADMFTTGAYHGTVVWSWNSLVMLTRGLEVHLSALAELEDASALRHKLKRVYTKVWDVLEANNEHLGREVWSWSWHEDAAGQQVGRGGFVYTPLSHVRDNQTESNAIQLWSLAFLPLQRRKDLEDNDYDSIKDDYYVVDHDAN